MKAEEYLKSKRLKNPPLDSGISGGGDAPRIRVSDMMNEYAKYQVKRMYTEEDIDKQIQDFKHDLLESTSDSIKQLCSGAILGLNRLKQFKKK